MSIFQKFLKAGVEYDNYESDLYVPVNEITENILHDYKYRCNVTTFICHITGNLWFDIPFAYTRA